MHVTVLLFPFSFFIGTAVNWLLADVNWLSVITKSYVKVNFKEKINNNNNNNKNNNNINNNNNDKDNKNNTFHCFLLSNAL